MRRSTSRRGLRASPALAAALTCGTLGGSLVGVGALGFDAVPAEAATFCVPVSPEPVTPEPVPPADASAEPKPSPSPSPSPPSTPAPSPQAVAPGVPPAGIIPGLGPLEPVPPPTPSPTPSVSPSPTPVPVSSPTPSPEPVDPDATGEWVDSDGDRCFPDPVLPHDGQPAVILPGDPAEGDGETDPGEDPDAEPDSGEIDPDEGEGVQFPTPSPTLTPTPTIAPTPSPSSAPTPKPSPKPTLSKPAGPITRAEVITRSASWVAQKVPYSQTRWWTDKNGKYRQDCSGMVSMAWHLSQKTNYWTGNLATVSRRIPSSSLKPGDILLRPRQHTLIFAGWANEKKTRFNLYEEYARGKPARYALKASLNHYLERGFGAYRYKNIVEGGLDVNQLLNATGLSDTVSMAAASTPLGPDVPSVQWTPETAEYTPEVRAPRATAGMSTTPTAVPDIDVDTLVATQRTLDEAVLEAGRLAAEAESASTGTYLIVAGLGLTFLAFPLGMGMRAGAWSPTPAGRKP